MTVISVGSRGQKKAESPIFFASQASLSSRAPLTGSSGFSRFDAIRSEKRVGPNTSMGPLKNENDSKESKVKTTKH